MSISRRQFFRGLVRQVEDPQDLREKRLSAIEAYVRTNLLPYDFALTTEQTLAAIAAAQKRLPPGGGSVTLSYEERSSLYEAVEATIAPWRDEYLRAEEVRRDAGLFVREFLEIESTPDERDALRRRFHVPYPAVLEDEVERQVRIWMSGLENSRLAACASNDLRDLVFSELRSWC